MSSMYRQIIIDRFKNPLYRGELKNPDIAYGDINISCGDELTYFIELDDKQNVQNISYIGKGCTICLASADLLAEALEEMNIDEIRTLTNDIVFELLGIPITPTRTKCALLGLKVVQAGINVYIEYGKEKATKAIKEKGKT